MRTENLAIALVTALLVGACAGMQSTKVEKGDVLVEVTNANHLDATVYLVSGGQQHRLGMVTTNGRERFRVAPRMIAPPGYLRVAADLLASNGSFVSHELALEPGDVVRLVVQPDVRTSYVLLR